MSAIVRPDIAEGNARLRALLAELDSYVMADQVADHLKLAGIKGEPELCDDCPISRFVRQRWQESTGQEVYVATDSAGVTVYTHNAPAVLLAELPTPSVVVSFMRRFDGDAYLDLIA